MGDMARRFCEANYRIFLTGLDPDTTAEDITHAVTHEAEEGTMQAEVLTPYRTNNAQQGLGGMFATDEEGFRELLNKGTIWINGEEVRMVDGKRKKASDTTMTGLVEMRVYLPDNQLPEMMVAVDEAVYGLMGGGRHRHTGAHSRGTPGCQARHHAGQGVHYSREDHQQQWYRLDPQHAVRHQGTV